MLTFHNELAERVGWLINMRWLAGIGATVTVLATTTLFDLLINRTILLSISGCIFAYNLLFRLFFRWLLTKRERPDWIHLVGLFANVQISVDLILLTVLIYFSGGVENPFFFFFIFHMIIASILLSPTESFLQATLAVVLFNSMLLLEYTGIIPHQRLLPFFEEAIYGHRVFLLGVSAVFTSTLYLSVYMATSITRKLRDREKELVELKNSLEKTNRQLRTVHEYRSQLLRRVEHELKAPLAAIQSLITVILTTFGESLESKVQDLLQRADRRTQGMLELIRRLLVLSRMQSAEHPFNVKPLELGPIIFKQLEILHSQAENKKLSIRHRIPEKLPQVMADPEAMEQVMINLLSNAIKYTFKGQVTVEALEDGDYVRVSVSDTGIGMSSEELGMIFEEFYRSREAKAKTEGTGLGLSIVKQIIEGHGGKIQVSSAPGKGSTFSVTIPKAVSRPTGQHFPL